MKLSTALLAAAFTFGTASSASAASIVGLFNTGVHALGNKLATNNQVDLHYLTSGGPSFTTDNPA